MRSFRSFANDDRHVMAKHASVYPAPEELEAVQALVSTVEGALKKVSDWMDGLNKSSGKTSINSEPADDKVEDDAADTKPDRTSVLCGVTRVGLVAKGLLIKGDMDLELVLMCREKPTKLLLYTISANLPLQIQLITCHSCLACFIIKGGNRLKLSFPGPNCERLTSRGMMDGVISHRDEIERMHLKICH